jgi:P protein
MASRVCAIILIFKFCATINALRFYSAYNLAEPPFDPRVGLIFKGSFLGEHYDNDSINFMYYYLAIQHTDGKLENISDHMRFPVVNTSDIDLVKEMKRSKTVHIDYSPYESIKENTTTLSLNLYTNFDVSFPVHFAYDPAPLNKDVGIIYAAIVLLGLYIMIIWELVHRTFAAIIASTMSIGN